MGIEISTWRADIGVSVQPNKSKSSLHGIVLPKHVQRRFEMYCVPVYSLDCER